MPGSCVEVAPDIGEHARPMTLPVTSPLPGAVTSGIRRQPSGLDALVIGMKSRRSERGRSRRQRPGQAVSVTGRTVLDGVGLTGKYEPPKSDCTTIAIALRHRCACRRRIGQFVIAAGCRCVTAFDARPLASADGNMPTRGRGSSPSQTPPPKLSVVVSPSLRRSSAVVAIPLPPSSRRIAQMSPAAPPASVMGCTGSRYRNCLRRSMDSSKNKYLHRRSHSLPHRWTGSGRRTVPGRAVTSAASAAPKCLASVRSSAEWPVITVRAERSVTGTSETVANTGRRGVTSAVHR